MLVLSNHSDNSFTFFKSIFPKKLIQSFSLLKLSSLCISQRRLLALSLPIMICYFLSTHRASFFFSGIFTVRICEATLANVVQHKTTFDITTFIYRTQFSALFSFYRTLSHGEGLFQSCEVKTYDLFIASWQPQSLVIATTVICTVKIASKKGVIKCSQTYAQTCLPQLLISSRHETPHAL